LDNTETKISDISEDYLNAYKLLLLYKIKDLKQPNAEDIKNLALYYGSNYIFAYNYNVTERELAFKYCKKISGDNLSLYRFDMDKLKIDLQKCTCKSDEYRSVSNFIHNSIPERDAWEFPLDDKTAVVHLRSSDVINNPWKDYLQPICDYFVRGKYFKIN